jgi:hypothetical protein
MNISFFQNIIIMTALIALIFSAAEITTVLLGESSSHTAMAQNETEVVINETAIYSNKTTPAPENSR